jgi:hypothetical protein
MQDFTVPALGFYRESHFFFFLFFLFFFMISAWALKACYPFCGDCLLPDCFGHLHESLIASPARGSKQNRLRARNGRSSGRAISRELHRVPT